MFLRALRNYLSYLIRHKWYVFKAGRVLGVGFWQLLIHDWSKFTHHEFLQYMRSFNYPRTKEITDAFDYAWLHHQKMNPHHWQYWVLIMDSGNIVPMRIPSKYLKEMVADWIGAGKALGKDDARKWYEKNKDKILLHPSSRDSVEFMLGYYYARC